MSWLLPGWGQLRSIYTEDYNEGELENKIWKRSWVW